MAEALGVASGVAGIVSLVLELAQTTNTYVTSARNAGTTVKSFERELSELFLVLQRIQDEVQAAQSTSGTNQAQLLQKIDPKALADCNEELVNAKSKLRRNANPSLRRSLLWPFKETETRRLVEALQRHRSVLTTAISLETFQTSNEILKGTKRTARVLEDLEDEAKQSSKRLKQVADHQAQLLDNAKVLQAETKGISSNTERLLKLQQVGDVHANQQERLQILTWLSDVDPSIIHNAARKKCYQGTGHWFLDSSVVKSWIQGDRPLLWLHGGPGAGKTVLTSTLVDYLKSTMPTTSIAYYYFTFTDSAMQKESSFLRSTLRQLSRMREVPQGVRQLYEDYAVLGLQPSVEVLVDVLSDLLSSIADAFVVIDAVDECVEPEEMCRTISLLQSSMSNRTRFLLTSRPDPQIRDAMMELPSRTFYEYALQATNTNQDIQKFVQQQLTSDRILKRRSEEEKAEIELALMSKADGMFRYVSCQLEILKTCRTTGDLKKALQDLPEGLEETYDRILRRMSKHDRALALAGLQLLMYSERELTLEEFADAMVIPCDTADFSIDECRLANSSEIVDICSGLVTIGRCGRFGLGHLTAVRLAHLSVHDYLAKRWNPVRTSDSNESAPVSQFEESFAHCMIGFKCLSYLRACPADNQHVAYRHLREHPFLEYSARYWHSHARKTKQDPDMTIQLKQQIAILLDANNVTFSNWLRLAAPILDASAVARSVPLIADDVLCIKEHRMFVMSLSLKTIDQFGIVHSHNPGYHQPACYAEALGISDFLGNASSNFKLSDERCLACHKYISEIWHKPRSQAAGALAPWELPASRESISNIFAACCTLCQNLMIEALSKPGTQQTRGVHDIRAKGGFFEEVPHDPSLGRQLYKEVLMEDRPIFHLQDDLADTGLARANCAIDRIDENGPLRPLFRAILSWSTSQVLTLITLLNRTDETALLAHHWRVPAFALAALLRPDDYLTLFGLMLHGHRTIDQLRVHHCDQASLSLLPKHQTLSPTLLHIIVRQGCSVNLSKPTRQSIHEHCCLLIRHFGLDLQHMTCIADGKGGPSIMASSLHLSLLGFDETLALDLLQFIPSKSPLNSMVVRDPVRGLHRFGVLELVVIGNHLALLGALAGLELKISTQEMTAALELAFLAQNYHIAKVLLERFHYIPCRTVASPLKTLAFHLGNVGLVDLIDARFENVDLKFANPDDCIKLRDRWAAKRLVFDDLDGAIAKGLTDHIFEPIFDFLHDEVMCESLAEVKTLSRSKLSLLISTAS